MAAASTGRGIVLGAASGMKNLQHLLVVATTCGVTLAVAVLTEPGATEAAADAPDRTLTLTALVRDFRAAHERNGHPDFQAFAGRVHLGLVEPELGPDDKPVMADAAGWQLQRDYRDEAGRPINPWLVRDGTIEAAREGRIQRTGARRLTSPERFDQWYRDVPGVNVSYAVDLVLHEDPPGSGVFVYDSHGRRSTELNAWMQGLPIRGFFPINGRGWGNYRFHHRGSTNFHFTTELATTFTYREDAGYVFGFSGDDDLWVFIDGRLVIDLGGVHPEATQWVDLDELDWLEDGETYAMHIFHAERRTVQSNFRVETTIPLRPRAAVQAFDAYD